ncbi:DUF317 domain-containing protein [Streptomyces sp. NPDC001633]|uniref:DUF317 domain-containing protein n=1 Tax=Streptomyces sp. NPDC001633 TaxID=3364595 RepID=UPI00369DF2BE
MKLTSPDTVSALTLDPSANGNRWWTISTCPRTGGLPWQASFDGHTPAEAIAAYADALTGITPAHRQDPFAVLKGAGWEGDSQSPRFVMSPDGLCELEHFVDDVTDCWFVRTILPLPDQHRLWGAYFSGEAPPHLISAFAAALVDPAPLPRARAALPLGCHRHLVAAPPTWLSNTQHERQISARVASVRNAARRAQRAAAKNSTTPASVPPPAPGSLRTH